MFCKLIMGVQDAVTAAVYGPILPVIRRRLQPRPRDFILDVGGGTGMVAQLLAPSCLGAVVLDPEGRKVRFGADKRPGFTFLRGVGEDLPFRDGSFDAVLFFLSFHHLRDQASALREALRVMKRHGRLLVLEVDPQGWVGRVARLYENNLQHLGCRYLRAGELASLLRGRGLRVTSADRFTGRYLITASR